MKYFIINEEKLLVTHLHIHVLCFLAHLAHRGICFSTSCIPVFMSDCSDKEYVIGAHLQLTDFFFPVLTVVFWPSYRFLKRQVRLSGILISLRIFQFVVIHTVKGFSIVNEAGIDVFLEFPYFLYDPTNVGDLISGSSAFWDSPDFSHKPR